MKSLLYLIAVIAVIGWILGLTVWNAGNIIHFLLIIAIIAFLLTLIKRA